MLYYLSKMLSTMSDIYTDSISIKWILFLSISTSYISTNLLVLPPQSAQYPTTYHYLVTLDSTFLPIVYSEHRLQNYLVSCIWCQFLLFFPFAHSSPATLASSLFLEHVVLSLRLSCHHYKFCIINYQPVPGCLLTPASLYHNSHIVRWIFPPFSGVLHCQLHSPS